MINMEKEEGEMSDDNAMLVDDENDVKEPIADTKSTMLYKAEKNGIVITELEKIDAAKLEERAKRFGLNLSGNRLVSQTQIDELYAKSGIESDNKRHFRFDTLHLNGIDGLSTKEIFEYLEDYKPVSLERVDEISCNIVCPDHISVALALLVHSREIRNEELAKMLAEKSKHHWREGMPHPKKDLILMRFATNGDKKMFKNKPESPKPAEEYYDQSMDSISKNPWGDLCKSWGVYDHQEIFQRKLPKNDYEDETEEPREIIHIKNKRLAQRLGKRSQRLKSEDSEESSGSGSEWKKKSKTPRMRMHADDEESKNQKKKQVTESSSIADRDAYAPLSIEVVNSRSSYTPRESMKLSDKFKFNTKSAINLKRDGIQSRLGSKVVNEEGEFSSDDCSSESSEHNIMSRVQKVSSAASAKSTSNVWDRLETQRSKDSAQSDLRQILKSRKQTKADDLRDIISKSSKSKKTNLRIEIDNTV